MDPWKLILGCLIGSFTGHWLFDLTKPNTPTITAEGVKTQGLICVCTDLEEQR